MPLFVAALIGLAVEAFQYNHHHQRVVACASRSVAEVLEAEELGCLPFGSSEILLPGQARYFHLYEARFLSLFEHATSACGDLLVLGFFLGSDLLKVGVVGKIERWERLDVGVGATVRGIARCDLKNIGTDDRPYLFASVERLVDECDDLETARRVRDAYAQVQDLAKRHAIAQDKTHELVVDPRAMLAPDDAEFVPRADDERDDDLALRVRDAQTDALSNPELLSFLALEGAAPEVKLKALVTRNQTMRLDLAHNDLKRQRDELAAKAAIKSLNLSWATSPATPPQDDELAA